MDQLKEIWLYIVSIAPSLTAVLTQISTAIIILKNFRAMRSDDMSEIKAMKREYRQLNATCLKVMEENAELKEEIKKQTQNFELLRMELENVNKEERI